jgi:hypothetical protein
VNEARLQFRPNTSTKLFRNTNTNYYKNENSKWTNQPKQASSYNFNFLFSENIEQAESLSIYFEVFVKQQRETGAAAMDADNDRVEYMCVLIENDIEEKDTSVSSSETESAAEYGCAASVAKHAFPDSHKL